MNQLLKVIKRFIKSVSITGSLTAADYNQWGLGRDVWRRRHQGTRRERKTDKKHLQVRRSQNRQEASLGVERFPVRTMLPPQSNRLHPPHPLNQPVLSHKLKVFEAASARLSLLLSRAVRTATLLFPFQPLTALHTGLDSPPKVSQPLIIRGENQCGVIKKQSSHGSQFMASRYKLTLKNQVRIGAGNPFRTSGY